MKPHCRQGASEASEAKLHSTLAGALRSSSRAAALRLADVRRNAETHRASPAAVAGARRGAENRAWRGGGLQAHCFADLARRDGKLHISLSTPAAAAAPTLRLPSKSLSATAPFQSALAGRKGHKAIPAAACNVGGEATAMTFSRPRAARRPHTSAAARTRLLPYSNAAEHPTHRLTRASNWSTWQRAGWEEQGGYRDPYIGSHTAASHAVHAARQRLRETQRHAQA